MVTLVIVYIVSGLLLAALALPLMAKKIKPNPFYGFRVQQTLDDPSVWYAVNQYAGKQQLAAGLGIAAVALIFYFIPGINLDTYALACLAVMAVLMTAAVTRSARYLSKITK